MSNEGDYAVLNRAEARFGLLTVFDDARDVSAMEAVIARLAPHERERLQQIIDENAGMAGVSNGRIARSGYANNLSRLTEAGKAAAKDAAMMSALQMMLADPAYRALYTETTDMLAHYDRAAAIAMMEAEKTLDAAETALAVTLDQAAQLPDGTRVFLSNDGTVYTAEGDIVDPAIAKGAVGLDDAPSHETYLARRKAVADAEATIDAIRVYQVDTLGRARDRVEDQDKPPSAGELREIQREVETAAPEQVARVAQPPAVEDPHPSAPSQTAVLNF